MTSSIYGVIRLMGHTELDLSFIGCDKLDQGNHLASFDSLRPKPFDYWHGGIEAEAIKQIVTARNTVFSGFKTSGETQTNPLTLLTHSILSMRQGLDDNMADASFLDKIFVHVYPKLEGRVCLSLDYATARSQFILVSRDTAIYLTSFSDGKSYYLMWSNEQTLEQRFREFYGERLFYFRHFPLVNGVMVLQSQFLVSKFAKWQTRLNDLGMLNSLDIFLQRKTRSTALAYGVGEDE